MTIQELLLIMPHNMRVIIENKENPDGYQFIVTLRNNLGIQYGKSQIITKEMLTQVDGHLLNEVFRDILKQAMVPPDGSMTDYLKDKTK